MRRERIESTRTSMTKFCTGGAHLEDEIIITQTGCEVYSTYPYTGVED
jgi:hypothetical protein